MKKIILSKIFLLVALTLAAQQDPQFSMNSFNRLFSNAGVAGSGGERICASLLVRNQWTGLPGNPKSLVFSGHGLVNDVHGVGFSVLADNLGQEKTTMLKGSYALNLGNIGIGMSVGMINKRFGNNWIPPQTLSDAAIPFGTADVAFDMDVGIYYKTDRMYAGLSATHLNAAQLTDGTSFEYDMARHYYVTAGYKIDVPSLRVVLEPSVFAKSDAASTQIDLNLIAHFNNRVWGGITYRLGDAIAPMGGVLIPYSRKSEKTNTTRTGAIKIGYAYDFTTSKLRQYSTGSHEVFVSYCFDIPEWLQKAKTVRFL
jgi:type IX secretion system PorP/SprF family membrane protein